MRKNLAQENRRNGGSGSKSEPRASKDRKSTRGTRPSQISTCDRHGSYDETANRASRSEDISHDADPVKTSENSHRKGVTPKRGTSLAISGNDDSSQDKGRSVAPLETHSANGLDDRRGSGHATDQDRCVPNPPSSENGHIDRTPVYVDLEPISIDSAPGTRRTADGIHGPQPDQKSTAMMAQVTSQKPLENLNQSESAWHRPEAFGSLSEPLAGFVADVAAGNGKRCARFLHERTDAVNETFAASTLRQAAISGVATGNNVFADSCVKALGVITFCRNSSRAQATKLFATMVLRDDEETTQKFQRVVEEERRLCLVLSATDRSIDQHTNLAYFGDPYAGEQSDQKRKKRAINENLHDLLWGSPFMDKEHIIGGMFQKKGSQFFRPGSMFKTVEHEVILTSSTESKVPDQSHYTVVPNILYYISVKDGENYCLALRAKTYGGLGLSMSSHISTSVESHAVIYDTEPRLLPGEPDKLKEQAIKVCLASGVRYLDPAMRLDLGRVYTIEYSIRAQQVGEVEKPTHLVAEWKRQMVGEC